MNAEKGVQKPKAKRKLRPNEGTSEGAAHRRRKSGESDATVFLLSEVERVADCYRGNHDRAHLQAEANL